MHKLISSTILILLANCLVIAKTCGEPFGNLYFYKQRLIHYHDSGQYITEIDKVEQAAFAYLAE